MPVCPLLAASLSLLVELSYDAYSGRLHHFWRLCQLLKSKLLLHLYKCTGYANSGSLYHAAKQLDQAMLVSKEENDFSDVSRKIEDMVPTEENESPRSVKLSN